MYPSTGPSIGGKTSKKGSNRFEIRDRTMTLPLSREPLACIREQLSAGAIKQIMKLFGESGRRENERGGGSTGSQEDALKCPKETPFRSNPTDLTPLRSRAGVRAANEGHSPGIKSFGHKYRQP